MALKDAVLLLDSNVASAVSEPFKFAGGETQYRWFIDGMPGANIVVIQQEKFKELNAAEIHVRCSDWDGATLRLQSKTNLPGDIFKNTGDNFTEDDQKLFYYGR